jgi:hypothetical protein
MGLAGWPTQGISLVFAKTRVEYKNKINFAAINEG